MPTKKRKPPPFRKLEASRLKIKQLEGFREDIDLEEFNLKVGGRTVLELRELIVSGDIERTIEGASTVTIGIQDQNGDIQNSHTLSGQTDIKIDGLWFRLVKTNRSGDVLTLTYEDREIAILRTYRKIKIIAKNVMTRAQFIRVLVKEVREVPLRLKCPDLRRGLGDLPPPPGGGDSGGNSDQNRAPGFPPDTNKRVERQDPRDPPVHVVKVQNELADKSQLRNITTVLNTGLAMGARRKVLVCAIMTGTVECHCRNCKGGDADSVGFFQQRASQGWPASRIVKKDAQAFFAAAMAYDKAHPNAEYWVLCADVQRPREDLRTRYRDWRAEAEHTVDLFGITDDESQNRQSQWQGQTADDKSSWIRGTQVTVNGKQKMKEEDSWKCMGRLADEIGYRRFMLNGTVYFISEVDLFKSRPRMTVRREDDGIDGIDHEYDIQKLNATVTITAHIHRWEAPPGSVIAVRGEGLIDGKWLVSSVRRPIFSSVATITCKKPRPVLPEPNDGSFGGTQSPHPPPGVTSKRKAAQRILDYWKNGRYRDDNGQQLTQLQKTARGEKLLSQCGTRVRLDDKLLNFILFLLDNDYMVGTFALCEDHHCNDGQHPKGQAVDISSLGQNLQWYPLNTPNETATRLVKEVMGMAAQYGAWDVICNGVGRLDPSVQSWQIDNGHRRGGVWETDHTNHCHVGIAPGGRN